VSDDIEAYRVDLVLSGFNMGPDLGNATWHSGTLAAAKQGVLLGIRGIALSAPVADETTDFIEQEPWVVRALETILERDEPSLVNVNFPLRPRGMSWTRQAVDRYDGTVVPLRLDLTDHEALAVSAEAAAR
jgi:5'-nucleotidase